MRWTQTLIPTRREAPAGMDRLSDRLLVRAGLRRPLADGAVGWLPLGLRSLAKATQLIRDHMNRTGALEVLAPAGHENIAALARDQVQSYKQLPLVLFQFQNRGENQERPPGRARAGREGLVLEVCGFDVDPSGQAAGYERIRKVGGHIMQDAGLDGLAVEAEAGPQAERAHAFLVPIEHGPTPFIHCPQCGYAAHIDRAEIGAQDLAPPSALPRQTLGRVHTPGWTTIEQVSRFLGCRPEEMIKTLLYVVDGRPVAVLVRGDHEANEHKLARVLGGGPVVLADAQTVEQATGAPVGFAGPVGLSIPLVVDRAAAAVCNAVTGANAADWHLTGVNPGRDFPVDRVADVRYARAGDPCPRCGSVVTLRRGREVGRLVRFGPDLGQRLDALVLDEQNAQHPMRITTGEVDVDGLLAACVETHFDDHGIIWSPRLAPYQVVIVLLNPHEAALVQAAEALYTGLAARGIDVLLDDRDVRAGVKFKDADLIGFPVRVVVGQRYGESGQVEIVSRATGRRDMAPVESAVGVVAGLLT